MKRPSKLFIISAVIMMAFTGLQSCVSEAPFSQESEGTLRINAVIRGDVTVTTRAQADYDQATLEKNLVVYIERPDFGVVRKYLGKDNLPPHVTLPVGSYVAEAWTGDSVSASWEKKFYRAYKPFELSEGSNSLDLKCNIANAIVSVTPASLDSELADFQIRFWHSRCENLAPEDEPVFDAEKIRNGSKLYFMMPTVDKVSGMKESVINYELTCKDSDGTEFVKTGEIENVMSAHEYQVTVSATQKDPTTGGALIRLEIMDIPVIDETVDVFSAPVCALVYGGKDLNIEDQINMVENVYDATVTVVGFGGLKNLNLTFSDNFQNQGLENVAQQNLTTVAGEGAIDVLNSKGISFGQTTTYDKVIGTDGEEIRVDEIILTFSKQFFESLPKSEQEYSIIFNASDGKLHSSSHSLRFANMEAAIERAAPVGTVNMQKNPNYMAIKTTSATLFGEIYDESAAAYGIKYREIGTSNWIEVNASASRAGNIFSVVIDNLKAATTYEYKAYCEGFEEQMARMFTTESVFIIPNSSMEEWSYFSENSKVLLPGADGERTFWDSGNHGSSTMNVTLTQGSEDMKHSGSKSARLRSQFVGIGSIGKFAAGNLFAGSYLETQGTDGRLEFGRAYNGSHPTALSFWANYRPGIVEKSGAVTDRLNQGDTDLGQVYVAISTKPVEILTKNAQKLFNPEGDEILAYGEVTWSEAFGADGELEQVTIPLTYNEKAVSNEAKYLIIVCSASKWGDYFCGGEGSVMYIDDFELLYE